MASPPTGTLTFLFTDIEGSTRLWEHDAPAMQAALARHDELLRGAIEERGGYVFKTVGDAFCCAFPTAPDALEAALQAQRLLFEERWAESDPLRVRMALHMGAAQERDGDYFGPPLNRVARLLSAAHGGQVLLSAATHEMVRDQVPAGMNLAELGEHRLKDLFRPEKVFQLVSPDLPSEFPPLRTLDAYRNNLPLQPTPLVGREKEVAQVCDLLRSGETRLLTLTGPGGIGKTRVALQTAADLLEDFPDGTFFVPLATLTEAQLFSSAIAETLGVKETGEQPLDESLEDYLGERRMLLVLDNFEQVLGAAPAVTALLAGAPGLKVLATSRAPLALYGEHEFPVPPLTLPDLERPPPLERLTQYEAVGLFVERARAIKPDFEVTNESAPAVAEICVRLDGLPLAIELAAARIKMLPPQAMLQRLSSRLKLLTGGARDLPERQRTLRGAIEWSHALLEEGEKTLFALMAVFSGGRTLEAIEAVCDAGGDLLLDAFEGVSSLLDKSLLRQEEGPKGEPRFVMLETIHEYARERLQESGEAEEIGRGHIRYFLALAEEAAPELTGADQVSWMDRLEAEHDNFRAALSRSLEAGDAKSALRIGGALWRFWNVRGHFSEGRHWLGTGLSGGEAAPVVVRAEASLGLGYLELRQGDYGRAVEDLEASLSLYRGVGDRRGEAYALCFLGWIALDRSDLQRAQALLEESLALSRAAGTARDVSVALNALAMLNVYRGDYARATAMQEESLSLAREASDVQIIAIFTYNSGFAAAITGEYERAEALVRESQELFREVGDRGMAPLANSRLGFLALSRNDPDRAEELCVEAIRELQEQAQIPGMDFALDVLASVAAARGGIRRAARLWGGVAGFREATGAPWLLEERAIIEPRIDGARSRLEEAVWQEEWEKGRSMTLDQAVGYALDVSEERAMEQD